MKRFCALLLVGAGLQALTDCTFLLVSISAPLLCALAGLAIAYCIPSEYVFRTRGLVYRLAN